MPFTLILGVAAANSALELPHLHQLIAVSGYTVIAILPTVILRLMIRKGQTVVDIQRWRVRHKTFFRVLTGVGFLVLAGFIFSFEVIS